MNKRVWDHLIILTLSILFVQLLLTEAASAQSVSEIAPQVSAAHDLKQSSQPAAIAATAEITLTEIITNGGGLQKPTDIANAGDSRLFIAEQIGQVSIYDGSSVQSTPFITITDKISSSNGEQGLLGLAFHPDYSTNGFFYLYYTHLRNESILISRLSRFKVSGDPNVADRAETILLEIVQDAKNHNGGDLFFGPSDGYLYIAVGDGGPQGDPNNRAQDKGQLLGKILRIDVDNTGGADCDTSGNSNYAIPAGNPFADGAGGDCDEIWSYGLRNPWRIAFDAQTHDLWIGDVGWASYETINFQPAASSGGENWGWRCYEGFSSQNTSLCGTIDNYEFPVFAYARGGSPFRCSVTGGLVYRGSAVPQLNGHYLFTDFCSRQFWSISGSDQDTLTYFDIPNSVGEVFDRVTTFGADNNGELYVAERGSNASIYQISAASIPCDPCEKIQKISLAAGWNMISSRVDPTDPAIETLLAPIENELVIIKNGAGEVYWPDIGTNDIGNWQVEEGYQLYVDEPIILPLTGPQALPAATPISLPAGWNLVSYLPTDPLTPSQALNSISSELYLLKNGDGQVYWPDFSVDQIGNMQPGQGYYMYLNSAGTLTYPAN